MPWARRSAAPVELPRVGILTPYELRRGLSTLTRQIEWALDGRAQVFPVRKLGRVDGSFERVRAHRADRELAHPRVVARGTRLVRWLAELDVWIGVERASPRLCAHCRSVGVRSIIVALPDWLPPDPATRVRELAEADVVVAYGAATARTLEREGLRNVVVLPLALAAPLGAARPTGKDTVVYFNVGVGGPVDRRQVKLVFETFRALLPRCESLHLLVKVHPDARGALGAVESFHPRMRVLDREVSNEAMRELLAGVDVTLFPSRFEGVGYPVLESLHAGVPVIATDGAPMNEIVEHERNGLLVRARDAGSYGAQTIRDVEPDDLRAQIERCATDRALLDRLKAGASAGRAQAADVFRADWRALIERLAPRRLNLGAGEDARAGMINLDIRPVPGIQVVASAAALPFADGSLDAVLAQDVLEHFPQAETESLLDEWVRVLRAGGVLRVQTPDVRALARALLRGRLTTERAIEWIYGAQDHPYNFHKTGFDERQLRALLAARGIEDIRRERLRVSSKNVCLEGRRRS